MVQTERRGRAGKWHKASEWAANDGWWITACGMGIVKRAATSAPRSDATEPMCERCRNSLQPDHSGERPAARGGGG